MHAKPGIRTDWLNARVLERIGISLPQGYVDIFLGFIPGCIGEEVADRDERVVVQPRDVGACAWFAVGRGRVSVVPGVCAPGCTCGRNPAAQPRVPCAGGRQIPEDQRQSQLSGPDLMAVVGRLSLSLPTADC